MKNAMREFKNRAPQSLRAFNIHIIGISSLYFPPNSSDDKFTTLNFLKTERENNLQNRIFRIRVAQFNIYIKHEKFDTDSDCIFISLNN